MTPAGGGGNRLIRGGIVAFLATCAILLLAGRRISKRDAPVEPGFQVHETAVPAPDGTFQVTLDVSDRQLWIHFDLGAGRVVAAGQPDPGDNPSADLIVRRYMLRAPHGAIDLGRIALADARVASGPAAHPATGPIWRRDEKTRGELQNPALANWYSYSYWTHDLRSLDDTYAIRLRGGGVAYLKIVSYYCQPEGTGCLTLRYRLDLEGAAAAGPSG